MTRHSSQPGWPSRCRAVMRSKWFLPLFILGLGLLVLAVSWVGGQLGVGVYALAVMVGFALLVLLLTGRSETIRGLTVGRDERFAQIDLRATAVAGLALIVALIVAFVVEIARGHSGNPYSWLAAIFGLTYVLAIAFFRWRS